MCIATAGRGHDSDIRVVRVRMGCWNAGEGILHAVAGIWGSNGMGRVRGTWSIIRCAMMGSGRPCPWMIETIGHLGRQSDEFVADIQGEAFKEICNTKAEMDVVDDAGSECFDCIV